MILHNEKFTSVKEAKLLQIDEEFFFFIFDAILNIRWNFIFTCRDPADQ